MLHDFNLILDPPPHGFYTFEDVVSGNVTFQSSHDEKIGWVYVFFHGWVNVEITRQQSADYNGVNPDPWSDKGRDKEILFQTHIKVYEGYEKLRKKTKYEWSFKFSFKEERAWAAGLPTSGHYSITRDNNWWSSVQYKVVASHGEIGQSNEHIRYMLNPTDPMYQKGAEPSLKSKGGLLKLRDKLRGDAEQELKFVQIRDTASIDSDMLPPLKYDLNVDNKHVPQLALDPFYSELRVRRTTFPFSVELQIARSMVPGEPFRLLLRIASSSNIWNQNPPAVMLTSFKIEAFCRDLITIGEQRADEKFKPHLLWEAKRLKIPLSSEPVDIGKIYSLKVDGPDFVQSFDTKLLHRDYNFPVELNVDVGGRTFLARFFNNGVTILSPVVAKGKYTQSQPPNNYKRSIKETLIRQLGPTGTVRLQRAHVGTFTHVGAGLNRPLAEHSIMEAAIAVSRMLTEAGIQHSFPGGTLIEILPSVSDQKLDSKAHYSVGTDSGNLRGLFTANEPCFRVLDTDVLLGGTLNLEFRDPKHGENISIEIHDLQTSEHSEIGVEKFTEKKKEGLNSMNLTPTALLNYRLWCLATHQAFGEQDIHDIEPLVSAFLHDLKVHGRKINLKFARVALRTHPGLLDTLTDIEIDLTRGKGKEVDPVVLEEERLEGSEEELPPYQQSWGVHYEQQLTRQLEETRLKEKWPAPEYEAGPSKRNFGDNFNE